MGKFIKQQTSDKNLQIIQDNISKVFASYDLIPILSPVYVEMTFIAGVITQINHNLTRNITGWIVISKNSATNIYQTSMQPLKLISTNNTTATIMVF